MQRLIASALLALLAFAASPSFAQSNNPVILPLGCGTASFVSSSGYPTIDSTGKLCVNASVSASISGFPGSTQTTGTPISVTTGGVTGTLPAGTVVVASNVGATNGAYCKLGASATTSDQLIPPNSWFGFTVGTNTQLTCITSTSTTTVNMVGGAGLPTGSGGGGGGSGGAVTLASGAVASGAYASGALASGAVVDINNGTNTAYAGSGQTTLLGAMYGLYNIAGNPVPCKAAATWNASTGLTGTQPAGCDGSAAFWHDMGAWAGVGLGAPSNFGTTPGAVEAPGVNASQFQGTTAVVAEPCQTATKARATINFTTSGLQSTPIVAGVSSKKTYVCQIIINNAVADNIAVFGATTGTSCATGTYGIYGGATAATGMNLAANSGFSDGNGGYAINWTTNNNDDICFNHSASGQVSGKIVTVQQ